MSSKAVNTSDWIRLTSLYWDYDIMTDEFILSVSQRQNIVGEPILRRAVILHLRLDCDDFQRLFVDGNCGSQTESLQGKRYVLTLSEEPLKS